MIGTLYPSPPPILVLSLRQPSLLMLVLNATNLMLLPDYSVRHIFVQRNMDPSVRHRPRAGRGTGSSGSGQLVVQRSPLELTTLT